MYVNGKPEEKTGEDLLRILNCARVVEECYRKKIINKKDVRQARIGLQEAYNGDEIDIALLVACVTPMKQILNELNIRQYIM